MPSERFDFPNAGGEKLAAVLDLPAGEARAHALFAHCFTCGKNVLAAKRIAEALNAQGIAVLRFDFTGIGSSEGEFANTTFSSNVADLVAAADHLRAMRGAPSLLIGHSLGGAAVLAAAEHVAEAKGVVTIAAPSDPGHVTHLFGDRIEEIHAHGEAEVALAGRPFRIRREFLHDVAEQKLTERIAHLRKALQDLNGEAPMFFGKVFGLTGAGLQAEATAAQVRNVKGFSAPYSGENIDILPYALDLQTWNAWIAGTTGTDSWSWDNEGKSISQGSDGWLEVNLFPQGTGSPGNRGTVDIGGSNNSTADIARQIVYGISPADLAHHGGSLEFDDSGKLYLNGDTGISAGVKDELASIKGKPRIIPIFSEVHGPGNNAEYTIVKWMGIRIMDVKLTGPMSQKRVTIQAAPVVAPGVVPTTITGTSSYVYSPVVLVK